MLCTPPHPRLLRHTEAALTSGFTTKCETSLSSLPSFPQLTPGSRTKAPGFGPSPWPHLTLGGCPRARTRQLLISPATARREETAESKLRRPSGSSPFHPQKGTEASEQLGGLPRHLGSLNQQEKPTVMVFLFPRFFFSKHIAPHLTAKKNSQNLPVLKSAPRTPCTGHSNSAHTESWKS